MEDSRIVELYWARNEEALTVTAGKYGNYCHKIAYNILFSEEDSQECVNDTYLSAWNSMPTARPTLLGAFLASITRNLALDKYRHDHAKRRGDGTVEIALDELLEVAGGGSTEEEVDKNLLVSALNEFLKELNKETRVIFVKRYFYLDTIEAIGKELGLTEGKVKTTLFRTRQKLKDYLGKEGFSV